MVMKMKRTIKDLPKVERPREKLMQYGPEKLSNSELLAILLRSGRKGENVVDFSSKTLKRFGTKELPNLTFDDLRNYPGLGPAKACKIVACFELGKRVLKDKRAQICLERKEIWKELKDIRNYKKEYFVVSYLDNRNQEIRREIISVGSLNASLVRSREVFESAVRNLVAQVILAHNHPPGDPEPSEDDLEITKRLVEAGKILGIEVVDHVIVANDGFSSVKDKNLV